jgi:hypothetical protein
MTVGKSMIVDVSCGCSEANVIENAPDPPATSSIAWHPSRSSRLANCQAGPNEPACCDRENISAYASGDVDIIAVTIH